MSSEPGSRRPALGVLGAADLALACAWLALGAGLILASRGLRATAGQYPTLVGGAVAVLAAIQIVSLLTSGGTRVGMPTIHRSDAIRAGEFFVGTWLLGLLTIVLGLVAGGSIWAAAVLMRIYGWPLRNSILAAVITMGAIAVIFPALGLSLPPGLLMRGS